METILAYIRDYFSSIIASEKLTSMWAQAMLQSEAIQGVSIMLALFITTKLRRSMEEFTLPRPIKAFVIVQKIVQAAAFPLTWLLSLLVMRLILLMLTLPVTYVDIVSLLLVVWILYKAMGQTKLKPWTKRLVTMIILAIPALMITDRLTDVITFLDNAKFKLGDGTISLWSVAKAGFMFFIIMWLFKTGINVVNRQLRRSEHITPSMRTLTTKMMNITSLVIAALISLNAIGIDLTALTFFGGALGIGIGFGLKTITSNFISGIILLLDKSVKPGDVLTIGDTYGMVEELNSRYVVMRRRDGMEVLVPNENLITSEVINWSFNNKQVRQVIKVGVAYDSDLEQVQQILLDVAAETARILQRPAPRAFIVAFGDSSIDFELRFWISDPEEGLGAVRSDLYMGVWKAFKREGIEIPFPQRVLHGAYPAEPIPVKKPAAKPRKKVVKPA